MNRFTRLSLATLLSLMSWMSAFGQGIVVEQSPTTDIEAQITHALAPLSMSPVTSGILLNRTLPIFPPELIGASTLQDSIWMDLSLLDAVYSSMYAARIPGNSGLPSPETAYANALAQHNSTSTVPIVLSALVFQRFVDDPFAAGVLDSINGQLRYATGVNPADAYTTGRVLASGLFSYKMGQQVTFTLPTTHLIGNTSIALSSIEVDAGDGLGFRALSPGGTLSVTYSAVGDRIIKIRFADTSGTSVVHYHRITVENVSASRDRITGGTRGEPLTFTQPIDCPTCICDDITADDGSATIHYCIRLSCLDNGKPSSDITKLKKPLIILDGIDLTWTENKATMQTLLIGTKRGMRFQDLKIMGNATLQDILDDNEYDVIFLDYHDHHKLIEENAAAFQAFLRMINDIKAANGSPHKNIVMGISMGGLIGRYGLREMEINGENHDVESYITFDSPMQGANVPLCLQGLILNLSTVRVPWISTLIPPVDILKEIFLRGSINSLEAATAGFLNVINSPAAKQMTKYNIYDPSGTIHRSFMDKLHNVMGPLQNCKTVGISNGSGSGGGGEIGPGQLAFSISQAWWAAFAGLLGINLDMNINGITAPGINNVVYDGRLNISYLYGLVRSINEVAVRGPSNMLPIDMVPGGTVGLAALEMKNLDKVPSIINLTLNAQNYTFIPTVSSLDVQGLGPDMIHPNLFSTDFSSSTYDNTVTQTGTVEITDLRTGGTMAVNNNGHVIMDFNNISLLLNTAKVEGEALTNPLTSRIYNFGEGAGVTGSPFRPTITPDYFKRNMHITGSGKVWINRNDRIAYTDVAFNVDNSTGTHFDVTMGKDICSGAAREVLVNNGGELSIGQWSSGNTGRLILSAQTKLTIGSGGNLFIDNKSGIVVKKGATLEILAGANVRLLGNSYIHVEKGGTIVVNSGGDIFLEQAMAVSLGSSLTNAGSVIALNGEIIATTGTIKLKGKGFLWIREGHILQTSTFKMKWEGHGKANTSFRVDAPVHLNGLSFETSSANVMINKKLSVTSGGTVLLNNSRFITSPTSLFVSSESIPLILNIKKQSVISIDGTPTLTMTRSEFDDVPVYTENFQNILGEGVTSVIKKKSINFYFKNGNQVKFESCNISGSGPGWQVVDDGIVPKISKIGVACHSVMDSKYLSCTFDGFNHQNGRTEDPNPVNQYIGIRNEKSPFIFMENSSITSCDHGIYAPDAVNVVMDHSAILSCDKGIEMTGSSSTGLVKMLCSSLLYNNYGVYGTDITLAIDGKINSQTTGDGAISKNYFDNLQSHFQICYLKKELEWEIPASYNSWVDPLKYHIGVCPSMYVTELIQSPNNGGACKRRNYADCQDLVPDFPLIHPTMTVGDYAGTCVNTTTCTGSPILENYWRGYTCYYNEDLGSAIYYLTPLAKDYATVKSGSQPVLCDHILAEAHAFAGGFVEYDDILENNHTLEILSACELQENGTYTAMLSVVIPEFIGQNYTILWSASDGGDISSDIKVSEIATNGIGKYVVIIDDGMCSYTTSYDFIQQPLACNPSCTCTAPNLVYDPITCNLSWPASVCPEYTVSLQRLSPQNVWVNIGNGSPHTITENGNHRLILSKAGCPNVVSNSVSVSCNNTNNGCSCPAPSLNLNVSSCTLSWTVVSCTGYVVSLQKLNHANVWENIGSTSPFTVTENGSYRIGLMTPGCPDVYSNPVSVTCQNPNPGCSCPAPFLNYNATACNLNWTPSSCPGFTTTLQKLNPITGIWSNITSTSPYNIPQNQNGSYQIKMIKPGCPDVISLPVYVSCSCTNTPAITAFVMEDDIPGNSQTLGNGGMASMSLSQSSPTGCVGDQLFIGFLSSEIDGDWTGQSEIHNTFIIFLISFNYILCISLYVLW